jgi:hypothetical protein
VDVVKFQFTEAGVIYEKSYDSLAELNNAITTGDGTVVLEPLSAE